MLDLFAGAAVGLMGALVLVARPGLFFRLSRLLELADGHRVAAASPEHPDLIHALPHPL